MKEVVPIDSRNELQIDSRSGSGWNRRTIQKKRSYQRVTGLKRNNVKTPTRSRKGNDQWSLRKKERVIEGESDVDGFELSIQRNGLELLHVLGKIEETEERDDSPGEVDQEQTVEVDQEQAAKVGNLSPKLPVYIGKFSTNFHVLCDTKRQHRVPMTSFPKEKPKSPKDELAILMKHVAVKEETAMKRELVKCSNEMIALENDNNYLGKKLLLGSSAPIGFPKTGTEDELSWDVDSLMQQMNQSDQKLKWLNTFMSNNDANEESTNNNKVNWEQRRLLQRERGFCFHIVFEDSSISERFASQCGALNQKGKRDVLLKDYKSQYFNIEKVFGNAAAVRHFSITNGPDGCSYFMSKDDGRYHYDTSLSHRLQSKIGMDSILSINAKAIVYLVTGPGQSYYAELESGECLWGIAHPDQEFKNVMDTFNVHRVAFGPFSMENEDSARETSWIVIGKDGKVAWRNIPSRLHSILSQRRPDSATPCEVALGDEGSYFIRFADGEISYCLPPSASELCEQITKKGASITNIALHPECSNSFIIRHTQTTASSR